jgi:uncharacterized protein YjgD (DUF1641 family)
MAKPIRQINPSVPDPAEEQAQAISDVVNAISENREAIVLSLNILKSLHEMGLLNAVNGLLEQRTEVGAIAIQQLNQSGMQNTIKNIMNVFQFIGSLDPEQMGAIFKGLNRGFEYATERLEQGRNPSLWRIGTRMRKPDVLASLATMVEMLQGLGEAFLQDDKDGQLH